ncbi:MAG: MFS transporter [Thaumarchaeota archaeon]|jgi:EmrB/QacA subfamily drug resistance transporter|nr:MFS transporter [Candidatus Terraquivivens yellowstonensis]
MTGLNARLAAVGFPVIVHELNCGIDNVVWIIQGFMVGSTMIQLIVGGLADIYGRVRLFNIGLIVFSLGGLGSGLATDALLLTIFRIVQGIGAAFLMTLSITILTDNIPKNMLGTWLGINQIAWRAGAIIGLTFSGIIIDYLGWRWIYLINFPIGIISYLWSLKSLKETYRPTSNRCLDWTGFILFTLFMMFLASSLTMMMNIKSWGYLVPIFFLLSAVSLIFFIIHESKSGCRALDLSIFKIQQFSSGITAQFLYTIGFGSFITLLVVFIEVVRGYSASLTGILLTPFELSFLIFGVVGGRLSDSFGFAPVATTGLLMASSSLYMLSRVGMNVSLEHLTMYVFLFGMGAGLFIAPNTSAIMTSIPPEKRGVASAIRTLSFNIGFLVSLNIAMLSLISSTSYEIATKLIISEGHVENLSGVPLEKVYMGISNSFLIMAIIMIVALLLSVYQLKIKYLNKNDEGCG